MNVSYKKDSDSYKLEARCDQHLESKDQHQFRIYVIDIGVFYGLIFFL